MQNNHKFHFQLPLSRVGAPSLSAPRLLFDAAQGARRYVAIRVPQRRQARPVDVLELVVRAFDMRQIPAFGFALIKLACCPWWSSSPLQKRKFHCCNAKADGPKTHLTNACATSEARLNPQAGACPSVSTSVKKVYS